MSGHSSSGQAASSCGRIQQQMDIMGLGMGAEKIGWIFLPNLTLTFDPDCLM
jgi:hypothetical protein